ncbi:MAG: hypothetical protein LWW79_07615 [Holophagaceae bacterium]|nr:hypothetical protein [Holophagaceae bacterium]
MTFYTLLHKQQQRLITYGELVPAMQMQSGEPCGPVYAEGISGYQYAVRIGDMDSPVLFHDRASVANAINHLRKDMVVDSETFEVQSRD